MAQTKLSEALSELDRREWERRNADIALYDTGMQFQCQRMELNQAAQLSDQAQREKSWSCESFLLFPSVAVEHVGLFVVAKMAAAQRFIIDARASNRLF